MTRRLPLLAAIVVALAASLAPAAAPAASAAAPDLTLTSETRYVVDPDKQAVHVSVALTAINHRRDTKTRLYYFDRAYIAVQPGTTNFKISAKSGKPTVHVAEKKADHNLLRIDFGKRLPAGSTRTFSLTFDIPDKGGVPTREIRIGASLVTFGAWSYASESTPGGKVEVVFPAGYNIDVHSDQLGEPKTDAAGNVTYATGVLAAPLSFFAYFVADRPNAYAETTVPVEVGGRPLDITVRAWPDDPAWAERVGGLLQRGVPALSAEIGLPWLAQRPFIAAEAISQASGGFSGRYDPTAGRIEIAYYADSYVVLHEAAHAWFDGSLLADRWANEGFASWYALQAANEIGEEVVPVALTPELAAAKVPLNAWRPVGSNDPATEDYGYAASAELARLIAERAGPTGLSSVWLAAREGIGAYQPVGLDAPEGAMQGSGAAMGPGSASDVASTEAGSAPPDWRGLLDLLEDRTGKKYDDLWRVWVVRHDEATLLDVRSSARREYDEVVRRAGEWQLPPVIRQAMRAWRFDQATELLAAADRALDDRDAVESRAAAAQLTAPRTLEAAFEGSRGFASAAAETDAELATMDAYIRATKARLADPDLIEQVGLWGTAPQIELDRAAAAFEAGDLRGSAEASNTATVAWEGAREIGRNRVMSMIAAALAALIGVGIVISSLRGISNRRARARRQLARRRAGVDQAHTAGGGKP